MDVVSDLAPPRPAESRTALLAGFPSGRCSAAEGGAMTSAALTVAVVNGIAAGDGCAAWSAQSAWALREPQSPLPLQCYAERRGEDASTSRPVWSISRIFSRYSLRPVRANPHDLTGHKGVLGLSTTAFHVVVQGLHPPEHPLQSELLLHPLPALQSQDVRMCRLVQ